MEHREIKGETIDGLQLVFVELKKFKPQTWPERKMAVLWLRFLTEIDGTIRDAPPELKENPDVRKALEMVEASALTPEERAKYDGFQDWLCRERRRANAERRTPKDERSWSKASRRSSTRQRREPTRRRPSATRQMRAPTRQRQSCGKINSTPHVILRP